MLREHCASVGRGYEEIDKTIQFRFDLGPNGEHVDGILGELKRFAELGIVHAQGVVAGAASIRPLELMGEGIIPVAGLASDRKPAKAVEPGWDVSREVTTHDDCQDRPDHRQPAARDHDDRVSRPTICAAVVPA